MSLSHSDRAHILVESEPSKVELGCMARSLRYYKSLTLRNGVLLEKLIVAQLLKNFNNLIKPESSFNIHTSKQVALSKIYAFTLFLKIHFNIILPSMSRSFKWSLLHISTKKYQRRPKAGAS
jgi:hypothetical protein